MESAATHNVILVVEDDFLVREYAAEVLEESGFEVLRARDADQALDVLEARPDVEVLFTDVNMPGSRDGMDLAREVSSRWPHIGLLITSGRGRPRTEIPDDGIFIDKPYRPQEVVRTVAELVRSH